MRIRSVWISEYKNLKDFSLELDNNSFLDVFVGKNGSGKSNLLEALIEIFHSLYENGIQTGFDFKITYEIGHGDNKKTIHISRTESQFVIGTETYNQSDQETEVTEKEHEIFPKSVPLPQNILVYYSGHNSTVSDLLAKYEDSFSKKIKGASVGDSRKFIGVGPGYRDILLASCLLPETNSKASDYIVQKLGITRSPDNALIVLYRPDFASGSRYDVDIGDPATAYWGIEGITREFVKKLEGCIKEAHSPGDLYNRNHDRYHLMINIKMFREAFEGQTPLDLFRSFDNLKTLGMNPGIGYVNTYEGGRTSDFRDFSDGQYQSVYIYALTEIFKNIEGGHITLLDEPDAFLHPEWQLQFLAQVTEIAGGDTDNNHILMTSHSAATVAPIGQPVINLFEFNGDKVVSNPANKLDVIRSLSAGMITFSEYEARISINNYIESSDGPVLFTEGVTDEIILEEAWRRLYGRQRPFGIQNAYDHTFLRNMMTRQDLSRKSRDRKVFALFDFDEAYNSWASFKKGVTVVEADPHNGLINQLPYEHHYVMLLPVSRNATIRNQVLNEDGEPWAKHGVTSYLSIELMFYGVDGLDRHFISKKVCGGGSVVVFAGDKVNFAENIVPTLDDGAFEIFRPMFESIQRVIQSADEP